jgi:hypothetical protein
MKKLLKFLHTCIMGCLTLQWMLKAHPDLLTLNVRNQEIREDLLHAQEGKPGRKYLRCWQEVGRTVDQPCHGLEEVAISER